MYSKRSDGMLEVFFGVEVGGGWRRVRWLMVARMVVSWWRRWSGTGGGREGLDWRVEERW